MAVYVPRGYSDFTMKRSMSGAADAAGHLEVLQALDGAGHVSQRRVAETLGMAAARVNRIIRALVEGGRVEVVDQAVRPYAYRLTRGGRAYLQELNYGHYESVVGRFREVEERIRTRLMEIRRSGVERVVFYGAGEIMEAACPLALDVGLKVVGVVDDDPNKQGTEKCEIMVDPPAAMSRLKPDAVVITTFRHAGEIRGRMGAGDKLEVIEV